MADRNRAARYAEIITGALAPFDRHEGVTSRPWETLSPSEQSEAEKRATMLITQVEGGSIPHPKDKREALELAIVIQLIQPSTAALLNEAFTAAKRVEDVDGPAPGSREEGNVVGRRNAGLQPDQFPVRAPENKAITDPNEANDLNEQSDPNDPKLKGRREGERHPDTPPGSQPPAANPTQPVGGSLVGAGPTDHHAGETVPPEVSKQDLEGTRTPGAVNAGVDNAPTAGEQKPDKGQIIK